MTPWPNLTDDEIESVMMYIADPAGPVVVTNGDGPVIVESDNSWLYWLLFGFLGLLALILMRVITNLKEVTAAKEGDTTFQRKSFTETIKRIYFSLDVFKCTPCY